MNYQEFKSELLAKINTGEENLLRIIEDVISKDSVKEVSFRKAAFSTLKDLKPILALQAIAPVIHLVDDVKFIEAMKGRSLSLIKEGNEVARLIYKKIILKSIELEFDKNITESNIDLAVIELDLQISKYPYLAKTLCRRLKNKYTKTDNRISGMMSNKLASLIVN